jgi:EmrB/QacA subfamily drug resistance transporter
MTETFRWTRGTVLALVVLCLAALLDTIDVTVVNVAMPTIKNDLHFSEAGLAWMVNAYMVPFGGFLLLGGRVGDVLGRRRTLLGGTVVFTLASLTSGLAQNAATMIASRAVQGAAAAFVIPMTLAMLASVFPAGPARNRAFAVWGGSSAVAGTLGLILGGLLVSSAGWRWIFLVNVPIGVFVVAAALRSLPRDAPARARRDFDLAGALAATAGAGLLAYAVVQTGDHGWGSVRTLGLFAGAAVLLGYFMVHEALIARSPLIPMSLWRNPSVTGANIVSVLQSSSVFAMFYSTTLYMQQVLHYSALRTGLAYVPLGLSILVAAGLAPVLVPRLGVRYVVAIGAAVGAGGMALLARITPHGGLLTDLIVPTVVVGIGAGAMFIPASLAALSGVPGERHGVASALLNVSRQLGGALGLAAIATVATARTADALAAGQGQAAALTSGFQRGFVVSAALLAVTALTALVLLRDDGRGETVNLTELQQVGAAA